MVSIFHEIMAPNSYELHCNTPLVGLAGPAVAKQQRAAQTATTKIAPRAIPISSSYLQTRNSKASSLQGERKYFSLQSLQAQKKVFSMIQCSAPKFRKIESRKHHVIVLIGRSGRGVVDLKNAQTTWIDDSVQTTRLHSQCHTRAS